MLEEKKRIKPDIFIATLLDDIRHEIVQTRRLTESMIEEGILEPLNALSVTTSVITVQPPHIKKPWFGVKITNEGPNSVFLVLNTEKSNQPQEIKDGETWGVQFKTAVIKDLMLWTEEGTANVRIRGER